MPPLRRRELGVAIAVGVVAALLGAWLSWNRAWLCDDAFISFRYAENLLEGRGLVFNAGERVEGITNIGWTLFLALGRALGASFESWAVVWGVAFHAATTVLLFVRALRVQGARAFPVAALVWAITPDGHVFATSGLETSAFTFLVFASFVLAERAATVGRATAAGVVLALASTARPGAQLLAVLITPFLVRRPRVAIAFAAGYLALWIPVSVARVAYYGSYFPNTYYAKSAAVPWWDQGFTYTALFFRRYFVFLLALPCGVAAFARRASMPDGSRIAAAMALSYALYVMRVGGDFMFARMLVPLVPLFLVIIEDATHAWCARFGVRAALAVALVAAVVLPPRPLGPAPADRVRGIGDEWAFYNEYLWRRAYWTRYRGDVMRKAFEGLPVRAGFMGSEAAVVFYSKVPTAIECTTGLTDAFIAHQPLPPGPRGRPGHEKTAPIDYLIGTRRAQLVIGDVTDLHLDEYVPAVVITFDDRTYARMSRWDPELAAALRSRGVKVPDVPAMLDATIGSLATAPADVRRTEYAKWKRFYFDAVSDPEREAKLRAGLP